MPQHYFDRTNQLTAPFQQQGQQPSAPQQDDTGLQEYLTEQVGSIRRSMNTVKNKSFPFATRLSSLNSFLSNFGEILGESADPITLDTFKLNEKEITDTAAKMFSQVEMLEKGELSTEDFFKVAAETFNETEEEKQNFEVDPNELPNTNRPASQFIRRDEPSSEPIPGEQPRIDGNFETITLPDGSKYAVPVGARVTLGQDGIPTWPGKITQDATPDYSHLWR